MNLKKTNYYSNMYTNFLLCTSLSEYGTITGKDVFSKRKSLVFMKVNFHTSKVYGIKDCYADTSPRSMP